MISEAQRKKRNEVNLKSYHKRMSTEEGREKERARDRKRSREGRRKILDFLGRRCVCCGETDEIYLEVDHVFNDGNKERKKRSHKWEVVYKKLQAEPGRYQILCCNCNKAKHYNDGELYIPEQ